MALDRKAIRIVCTLLCLKLPECLRWLIGRKGDLEAGTAVLRLVRPEASDEEILAEAGRIQPTSREEVVGARSWTRRLRVPILLAVLIAFFNQRSGINAVLYFAPRIYELAGLESKAALLQSREMFSCSSAA
ncbi:MAG: MFS transporter [Verrucomicrobiota bacterium]